MIIIIDVFTADSTGCCCRRCGHTTNWPLTFIALAMRTKYIYNETSEHASDHIAYSSSVHWLFLLRHPNTRGANKQKTSEKKTIKFCSCWTTKLSLLQSQLSRSFSLSHSISIYSFVTCKNWGNKKKRPTNKHGKTDNNNKNDTCDSQQINVSIMRSSAASHACTLSHAKNDQQAKKSTDIYTISGVYNMSIIHTYDIYQQTFRPWRSTNNVNRRRHRI